MAMAFARSYAVAVHESQSVDIESNGAAGYSMEMGVGGRRIY